MIGINIKGSYVFKQNGKIILQGNNLITFQGESFFLNRPLNDNFNTMKYIVLGNATNRPRKMDTKLGNETSRKECIRRADLDNKKMVLTCNFTTSEVLGTSEIGVANDNILISHDVFEKITDSSLASSIGDIEVEYTFQLSTSAIRSGWTQKTDGDYERYNIYYIDEPNEIIGVLEDNTHCGYRKASSMNELLNSTGVYYYDRGLNKLYIRNTRNTDPNIDTIIVQTK